MKICFVCLGNICRSPTAEGVVQDLLTHKGLSDRILVDSAGTAAYHLGEPADRRSIEVAARHGVPLTSRARRFMADDFATFDWIVAMDAENRNALRRLAPTSEAREKILLFREFDPEAGDEVEVPDPYYGGRDGFEEVFAICRRAGEALVVALSRQLTVS